MDWNVIPDYQFLQKDMLFIRNKQYSHESDFSVL
jgi:hypothetical protein